MAVVECLLSGIICLMADAGSCSGLDVKSIEMVGSQGEAKAFSPNDVSVHLVLMLLYRMQPSDGRRRLGCSCRVGPSHAHMIGLASQWIQGRDQPASATFPLFHASFPLISSCSSPLFPAAIAPLFNFPALLSWFQTLAPIRRTISLSWKYRP